MTRSNRSLWLIFGIVLIMAFVSNFSRLRHKMDLVPWRADFAAAQLESQRTHKPMLAYFTASWCGYCQDMHRNTWSNAKVADALNDYIPVEIDVDTHQDLARRFNISGMPSYAVLDQQGNILRFGEGYRDSGGFIAWLREMRNPPSSGM